MHKNTNYIILSAIFISFFAVLVVHAGTGADIQRQANAFADEAKIITNQDPRSMAAAVIKIFLGFIGTLFLAYFVYAGYLVMTAGGDADNIDKGKNIIKYSTIGVIIVLGAYGMVILLDKYLNPKDGNDYLFGDSDSDAYFRTRSENEDYTGCETSDPLDPRCAGQEEYNPGLR